MTTVVSLWLNTTINQDLSVTWNNKLLFKLVWVGFPANYEQKHDSQSFNCKIMTNNNIYLH
jgi:hypothetical protein